MNLNTTLRKSYDSQTLIMRTLFALSPDTNMPISTNYIVSTDGIGGLTWLNPFTNLSTAGTGVGYLPSTLNSLSSNLSSLSSYVATIDTNVYDYEIASTLQYSDYFSSIKIGYSTGTSAQGYSAIAIGNQAGYSNQGDYAISLGYQAGYNAQAVNSIAIGNNAASILQGGAAIAIGYQAGLSNQSSQTIAIGSEAGNNSQSYGGIAIGYRAGKYEQFEGGVAIGIQSGYVQQGSNSIGVGRFSAFTLQHSNSIAVGVYSGYSNQGRNSISVGFEAAASNQGSNAIAIGYQAGAINQLTNSIAIGYRAGYSNQAPSSIVISALTSTLNVKDEGFYVAPLRDIQTSYTYTLGYNSNNAEVGMINANNMNLVVSSLGAGNVQFFQEDNGKFFYYTATNANTLLMPTVASNGWNAYISLSSNAPGGDLTLNTLANDYLSTGLKGYLASDGANFYFI